MDRHQTFPFAGQAMPAAGFYKSQCHPSEEIVLEPAFHWARSDESIEFTVALVCSNCERLAFYLRPLGES